MERKEAIRGAYRMTVISSALAAIMSVFIH